MNEELYSKELSREEYFVLWSRKNNFELTEDIKERIYKKYLVKYEVFHRDNFTCQNAHCAKQCDMITVHHIKAQRNGGQDKPRNLITLCDRCHKDYEKAKKPITLLNNPNLPPHVRGHTFKLHRSSDGIAEWKRVKRLLKKFRKVLLKEGFKVSLKEYLESKDIDMDLQQIVVTITAGKYK